VDKQSERNNGFWGVFQLNSLINSAWC